MIKKIEKVFGKRPITSRLKVLLGAGAVAVVALVGAVIILIVPLYVQDSGDMSSFNRGTDAGTLGKNSEVLADLPPPPSAVPAKTIVAWDNVIDAETQDDFDKFLEQNEDKVVKITASASAEIVEVQQDGIKKTCIISIRGTGYIINCIRGPSIYYVEGFFTQRSSYTRRSTVFVEFEQVPDHTVIMANPKPKIVPYKP